jgi:hypothetical protein
MSVPSIGEGIFDVTYRWRQQGVRYSCGLILCSHEVTVGRRPANGSFPSHRPSLCLVPLHTVTREIPRPSHPSQCVRRGRTLGVAASATALTQRLDRRVRRLTMQRQAVQHEDLLSAVGGSRATDIPVTRSSSGFSDAAKSATWHSVALVMNRPDPCRTFTWRRGHGRAYCGYHFVAAEGHHWAALIPALT